MILMQDREPLQLGVGLGEREDVRLAAYASRIRCISTASTGHTMTQALHAMQSRGRGSQGLAPAMARQSTGQIATQSPQPRCSESGCSLAVWRARAA